MITINKKLIEIITTNNLFDFKENNENNMLVWRFLLVLNLAHGYGSFDGPSSCHYSSLFIFLINTI